jgi:exodeoxyribonuclease V alpha subunit
MRHAGVLRANAQQLLSGVLKPTTQEKGEDDSIFTPWTVEDRFTDAKKAYDSVMRHFEHELSNRGRDALLDVQVISPQYEYAIGVKALNRGLQRIAQRVLYNNHLETKDDDKIEFIEGDKVVQTKNDHKLNLMNGDQGIVIAVDGRGVVLEVQEGASKREVVVPKSTAEGLMLAYAITVHRAQGSQWDTVLAVHHSQHRMNSRKLVYTAATRAVKRVILIGDRSGLHNSLGKVDASFRRTLMAPTSLMARFARDAGVAPQGVAS